MSTRLLTLSMLAFLGGIWLMAFPYFGVWHDSVLYTVQALYRLNPQTWGNDLFFRYGSQDQFTVFSGFHARLLEFLGIEGSALLLVIIGKLIWFAALLFFVSGYLRGLPLWIGLVVLVSFSPIYDGNQIFSYGEPFVTGRIYAEALCLVGLGMVIRGRELTGTALAMAAIFVHPLMAIPAVVAAVLLSRRHGKKLFLIGLTGAALVVFLGLLGIDPMVRLFSRFDPVWLGIVKSRLPYLYLENWSYQSYGRMGFLSVLLLFYYHTFRNAEWAWLAGRMFLFGLGCVSLAWVGSSLVDDVLLTQLQTWRGLWLVQIVALSLLGPLSVYLWERRAIDRILLICLWSALLLQGPSIGVVAIASLAFWWIMDRKAPNWQPTRLIWWSILLLPLLAAVSTLGSIQSTVIVRHKLLDQPFWVPVLASPLFAVPMFAGLVWLANRQHRFGPLSAGLLGLVALACGVMTWDERNQRRSWDDYAPMASVLQSRIPIGSTVYWPGGAEPVWFWLRRAQYMSKAHTVGVLFSRRTAMVVDERQSRLRELRLEDGNPYFHQPFTASLKPGETVELNPGRRVAVDLCRDPELDFLVFPENKEFDTIAYRFTFPVDDSSYDLIDCRSLRAEPTGANG